MDIERETGKPKDMARYSKQLTKFILENYWLLKQGQVPMNGTLIRSSLKGSPHETAICWVADIDTALDKIGGNWLKVASIITQTGLEQIVHKFSYRQQVIIRTYLVGQTYQCLRCNRKWIGNSKGCPKCGYREFLTYSESLRSINGALRLLRNYMNGVSIFKEGL